MTNQNGWRYIVERSRVETTTSRINKSAQIFLYCYMHSAYPENSMILMAENFDPNFTDAILYFTDQTTPFDKIKIFI